MPRLVYKRFTFLVDTANTTYSKKFDLDKTIANVVGCQVTSNMPRMLADRGTQRIEIGGDEIVPEDFESSMLMCGMEVPQDQRYALMGDGLIPGNGEIRILFKDADCTISFSPYKFVLVLACQLKGEAR